MQVKGLFTLLILSFLVAGIYAGSTPNKGSSEKCASCHSDSPAFKEWQTSDHAKSIETLLKIPNVGRNCIRCHSADYNRVQSNPWTSMSDLPAPDLATSNPVSCSACHRHDSGIEHNLIMPADRLCVTCHVRFCGG